MHCDNHLHLIAKDLTKDFPRSPREMLAGYVIAARCVDKCRSVLADKGGEYHSGCPLDEIWLNFVEIEYDEFKDFIATGATDEEVEKWIQEKAKPREKLEIIKWNNEWRGKRLSECPDMIQEFMEGYVQEFIPRNRPVYVLFDIYDLEEQRI